MSHLNNAELPKDGVIAGGLAQRLRDALVGCQPDPRRVRVEFVNDCAFEVDLTNTTPSETQQSLVSVPSEKEVEEAACAAANRRIEESANDDPDYAHEFRCHVRGFFDGAEWERARGIKQA